MEHGVKKNSLVKIRKCKNSLHINHRQQNLKFFIVGLCSDCSYKLNYHHKKKEVTRVKKNKKDKKDKNIKKRSSHGKEDKVDKISDLAQDSIQPDEDADAAATGSSKEQEPNSSTDIWRENQQTTEEKSREEEFEEFLQDLFL